MTTITAHYSGEVFLHLPEETERFRWTRTVHALAASGRHVAVSSSGGIVLYDRQLDSASTLPVEQVEAMGIRGDMLVAVAKRRSVAWDIPWGILAKEYRMPDADMALSIIWAGDNPVVCCQDGSAYGAFDGAPYYLTRHGLVEAARRTEYGGEVVDIVQGDGGLSVVGFRDGTVIWTRPGGVRKVWKGPELSGLAVTE